MGKYKSKDEALVGGYNAIKEVGKPFKLPESLDKLPSDETRKEFRGKVGKLMGMIDNPDQLKQVNFSKGLSDGKAADETVVAKISEVAVKNGYTVTQVQDLVEMMNTTGTELVKAATAEMEKGLKEAAKTSSETLTQFYGADKLKENAELLRKAVQNNCDLSAEEVEQLAEDLAEDGYIFRKPALARILMDKIAPLAKEGETDLTGGGGGETPTGDQEFKKNNPEAARILGIK